MEIIQEARCPYCGDVWEMDIRSEGVSDEEFLEVTKQPYASIPCERCTYLRFD